MPSLQSHTEKTPKGEFVRYSVVVWTMTACSWANGTLLPILTVEKFANSSAVVNLAVAHVLPKILLAPLAARWIQRKGPKTMAVLGITTATFIRMLLPNVTDYFLFISLNLLIGTIGASNGAALLTMRSQAIGKHAPAKAHTLLSTLERVASIMGPACAGILLRYESAAVAVRSTALCTLLVPTILLWSKLGRTRSSETEDATGYAYRALWKMLQKKLEVLAVLMPLLGSAVLLGALDTFLFLYNTALLERSPTGWSAFLIAKGVGATLGSGLTLKALTFFKNVSVVRLYLWTRLLTGMAYSALATVQSFHAAVLISFLVALPEVTKSVCFYRTLQKNLSLHQEAMFHALSMPLFNLAGLLGVWMLKLHTSGGNSLQAVWFLVCSLNILCTLSVWRCTSAQRRSRSER